MHFYSNQHRHTCGVDLPGRNLYLCILDQQGQICLHKRLRCDPDLFVRTIAPLMRSTRDLLRRRLHFARKRAELLTHIHNTFTQYNLPRSVGRMTCPVNRNGLAELFDDPAVRANLQVPAASPADWTPPPAPVTNTAQPFGDSAPHPSPEITRLPFQGEPVPFD